MRGNTIRNVLALLVGVTALQVIAQEQKPYANLVDSSTRFAFKLFHQTSKERPEVTVLIAPSSITLDFALLQNGADKASRSEISSVFEFGNMSAEDINQQSLALRQALVYDPPRTAKAQRRPKHEIEPPPMCCARPPEHLSIAGSLWTGPNAAFTRRFLDTNTRYYAFKVASVTNRGPAAKRAVNEWISQRTGGVLTNALDSWRSDDFLVVDTIWFKGAWANPFPAGQTHPGYFTLLSGRKKQIPMMALGGRFSYLRGSKFQAVRLPYGHASMYVFLPDSDSSLKEFEPSLTFENWTKWLNEMSEQKGYVELPRFGSKYTNDLRTVLTELGMPRAFESLSSFQPLFDNPEGAQLTRVLQAVSIKVDEKGTEAAAATITGGVIGGVSTAPQPEPFRMIIDHPFFFTICDDRTQAILYMGAILDPEPLPLSNTN